MRIPFGWVFPGITLAATGVAIWSDSDLAIALPSATIAIVAAVLLFAEVFVRTGTSSGPPSPAAPPHQPVEMRTAFVSGRLGREKVVMVLDRLERLGPNPNLPLRRIEEIREFARMPTADFRRYVRQRLDELEDRT